jgi:hypothetical protein
MDQQPEHSVVASGGRLRAPDRPNFPTGHFAFINLFLIDSLLRRSTIVWLRHSLTEDGVPVRPIWVRQLMHSECAFGNNTHFQRNGA